MDIVDKLIASGDLTKEAGDRIRQNVAAFKNAAQADPEFRKVASEKIAAGELSSLGAGFKKSLKDVISTTVPAAIVLSAAQAGMQGAAGGISDLYQTVKNKFTREKNFNQMMEHNPQLIDHDEKSVRATFNTLQTFNPEYAADPLVAGAFVSNSLEMERVDPVMVNALVSAKHQIEGSRPRSSLDFGRYLVTGMPTQLQQAQIANLMASTARTQEMLPFEKGVAEAKIESTPPLIRKTKAELARMKQQDIDQHNLMIEKQKAEQARSEAQVRVLDAQAQRDINHAQKLHAEAAAVLKRYGLTGKLEMPKI